MPVKKKVVSRKKVTVKKKVATKKKVVTPSPKVKAIATRQTKTQIIADIAEETGLEKKQVIEVFRALGRKIEAHVKPRGSGEITIPETGIKVRRVIKPRTKARMGRNPATGEAVKIAAKPARKAVRITALKSLKDMV
ncbi:MAG: HU family DNA-binding protein [Pseudomonadota bacterium]|nr:HU family DNA-binding protein [Pseudomonadota bacterium]